MEDLPLVCVLLFTCNRTEMALRTVQGIINNLKYPKHLLRFYIADDGSAPEHYQAVFDLIFTSGYAFVGYHNEKIRLDGQENTYNSGKGWNRGLGICHQASDFVLVMEDDWELDEPLDLVPYVKLLKEREDVGICTFRILSVGADVRTVGHDGLVYLQYSRTTQYAYSGNPHIRHARYTKHYGWYIENASPGEIELKQDDVYRLDVNNGPFIWRPAHNISQWGAFKHIGNVKTWE